MERLSLHILSLLRLYGSVQVPGFGVLFLKSFPAVFSAESGEFLPPSSRLLFRPSTRVSEEQLLESYARKQRMAHADVLPLLEEDLCRLMAAVNVEGEATLPGLGTFYWRDGYTFFSSLYAPKPVLPVLDLWPPAQEQAPESELEVELPEALEEEETRQEDPRYHYHDPRYFYIPIHKTMAKIAASLLLVLVVGAVALIPFGSSTKSSSTASIAPIAVSESVAKAEAEAAPAKVAEVPGQKAEAEAKEDSLSGERLKVEPLSFKETEDEMKYYAVVAAFKSQKQVDQFIASHPQDKNAFKVVNNTSYNLISVSSTKTQEEMNERLPLIKSQYPDVWVYVP